MTDAPLSSPGSSCGFVTACFVFPHASDDTVGEVSLVRSAGRSFGLAFAEFAVDVDACIVDSALLDDAPDEHDAVDPSVAAVVESMLDRQPCAFG